MCRKDRYKLCNLKLSNKSHQNIFFPIYTCLKGYVYYEGSLLESYTVWLLVCDIGRNFEFSLIHKSFPSWNVSLRHDTYILLPFYMFISYLHNSTQNIIAKYDSKIENLNTCIKHWAHNASKIETLISQLYTISKRLKLTPNPDKTLTHDCKPLILIPLKHVFIIPPFKKFMISRYLTNSSCGQISI